MLPGLFGLCFSRVLRRKPAGQEANGAVHGTAAGCGGRSGFALLLVLITVSFATAIALLFLLSARQERFGTSAYAEASAARQLASQAVNMVIGQINAATREGTLASPVSWASQPGMIRTYNTSGELSNAYKLYSWSNLTEAGPAFSPYAASELPPANWASEPALYTDINQPVAGVYPIVDPSVLDTASTSTGFTGVTNAARIPWDFPGEAGLITGASGYFPNSNTVPMPVQWLYILQDGTWSLPINPTGNTVTIPNASATNPIVGRIAFWTDDETAKVNVNTASEGAYWDTPKAGTADELQFAGNPPLQNEFERLAGHPATTSISAVFPELLGNGAGFSRWLTTGAANSTFLTALQQILGYGNPGSATSHGLNPRASWGASTTVGGSQGGTYPINSYLATYEPFVSSYFANGYVLPSIYNPAPNTDRLYATADEMNFQPTRAQNLAWSNNSITAQSLSQRLFFLTANSKAPETTLYETPRISMWPITWPYHDSSYWINDAFFFSRGGNLPATLTPSPSNLAANTYMAYQEKLLAFCSTLNAHNSDTAQIYPYYFQRQDPDSPSWDWSNISRNQNLVSYLDSELSDPRAGTSYPKAPGIGASLGSKWDANAAGTTGWISLNCFDYIRSMVNQYTLDPNSNNGGMLYSYTGVELGMSSQYTEQNSFTAVPLNVNLNGTNYTTEGSYPALREAALVFYATQRNIPRFVEPAGATTPFLLKDVVNPQNWTNLISWNGTTGNSQTTQMQMVMLLNLSQMNPGIVTAGTTNGDFRPVFWVKVSSANGASGFMVNDSPINFPPTGGAVVQFNPISVGTDASYPNEISASYAASLFSSPTSVKTFNVVPGGNGTGTPGNWSLISAPIPINTTTNPYSFTFTGSKVEIDLYSIPSGSQTSPGSFTVDPTSNGTANLVSSQIVDFSQWNNTTAFASNGLPAGQLPLPLAPYWNVRQAPMMVALTPGATPTPVTEAEEQTASTQASAPPPTSPTVVGGVLMPYFLNGSTTPPNWQAEIVPQIGQLPGRVDSSQVSQPWGIARTGGSGDLDPSASENSSPGTNPEPMMYVYQDSTGTYTSTNFALRVAQLPEPSANTGLIGETLDNPPYQLPPSPPLSVNGTGQPLFNGSQQIDGLEGYQLITPYDTVISMVVDPRAPGGGDPRLIGRGINGGGATFAPIDLACSSATTPANMPANPISPLTQPNLTNFGQKGFLLTAGAQYHELGLPGTYPQITGISPPWQFGTAIMGTRGALTAPNILPTTALNNTGGNGSEFSTGLLNGMNDPTAGIGVEANVLMTLNPASDWTRLPGTFSDGGYLLRPDQEYQSVLPKTFETSVLNVPYFEGPVFGVNGLNNTITGNTTAGFFSPSRQVPSPVLLGTLPDSMTTGWQTLNFCPNPAVLMNSGVAHPGSGQANPPTATGAAYATAPDHLLLDLFWMPVAEPFPISEEFATAGKVNLNYAIMPFPYIQRKTALDALLKSVWLTAMPSPALSPNFPAYYKSYGMLYQTNRLDLAHTRYPVNVDATLRAFDYKFQQGDIFRVASQICDMFLYPNDPSHPNTLWAGDALTAGISGLDVAPSVSNITAWWAKNSFTADNEREAPYNALYSRLTTKSNTFTVHWRVQTLKGSNTNPSQWTEGVNPIKAELRGSTLIDRYIDPNANLPDYATNTPPAAGRILQPLSYYYKWMVDSETYFQPTP